MKITYTVMPIGHPVRSIEGNGALAARQVIKTTLKNLKRWYTKLRGTTDRVVGFDQQSHPNEIEVSCDEKATMTMIVDREESRNCANENLENVLRENLANNDRSVIGDDDDGDR